MFFKISQFVGDNGFTFFTFIASVTLHQCIMAQWDDNTLRAEHMGTIVWQTPVKVTVY